MLGTIFRIKYYYVYGGDELIMLKVKHKCQRHSFSGALGYKFRSLGYRSHSPVWGTSVERLEGQS